MTVITLAQCRPWQNTATDTWLSQAARVQTTRRSAVTHWNLYIFANYLHITIHNETFLQNKKTVNLCRYSISLYVPVELRCRCFYAINRRRMLVCYDLMTALRFIPEVSNQHFSRVRVDASSVVLERCWRFIFSRSMLYILCVIYKANRYVQKKKSGGRDWVHLSRAHPTGVEDVDVWYGSSLRLMSTGFRLGIWSAIRVFKSLIVVRHSPVAFCSTTLYYLLSTRFPRNGCFGYSTVPWLYVFSLLWFASPHLLFVASL